MSFTAAISRISCKFRDAFSFKEEFPVTLTHPVVGVKPKPKDLKHAFAQLANKRIVYMCHCATVTLYGTVERNYPLTRNLF